MLTEKLQFFLGDNKNENIFLLHLNIKSAEKIFKVPKRFYYL